jgi:apolipoprotein N-acyltransferase
VVHTITYFFMGLLAASFLNYKEAFSRPEMACWMRQFNDPLLVAGPLFQPIRGLLFALVLYPLREILFVRRNGWLVLCWLLVGIGILGTFGPAPGSLEGLIYTRLAVIGQLRGWLEVVPQAFLLSALLAYWVNRPEKKWLNWVLGAVFAVVMILPILGLLAHK